MPAHEVKAVSYMSAFLKRSWSRFGNVLSIVAFPLVLSAIFFIVITPIGLVRRLIGHDALGLGFRREAKSYWLLRTPPGPDPRSLKKQI